MVHRPPRAVGAVPGLGVGRAKASPALDRATMLAGGSVRCPNRSARSPRPGDRVGGPIGSARTRRACSAGVSKGGARLGPSRQDLEARDVGLARGPRDGRDVAAWAGAAGGVAATIVPSASRTSMTSPSTDGPTRSRKERAHQQEGHDDRDDERHDAEQPGRRRPRPEEALPVDDGTGDDRPGSVVTAPAARRRTGSNRKRTIPRGRPAATKSHDGDEDTTRQAPARLGWPVTGTPRSSARGIATTSSPATTPTSTPTQRRRSAPLDARARRSASRARPMLSSPAVTKVTVAVNAAPTIEARTCRQWPSGAPRIRRGSETGPSAVSAIRSSSSAVDMGGPAEDGEAEEESAGVHAERRRPGPRAPGPRQAPAATASR